MAVWKPDFGEYDYVWDFLCGVAAGNPWPEGNEDDLWVLAEEWAAVAQALGDAMQDAGPVVNNLIAAWGGDSGYGFLGLWETLGQSSESGLGAVADMASSLSETSDNAALELQYNKLTTLITVIITIISVFTALIGAFFTGGGSAAAIQPIMMGGRVAVQQSFRQLVRNIARKIVEKELRKELLKKAVTREGLRKLGKEATEELVEELLEEVVLVDGLSQAYQMVSGRRTSWDGSKTAASAIGATAGVPIGMGVAPAAQWAKNRAGRMVADRLSDATIDRINRGIDRVNSPTTNLGGLGKQFAGTPGQALSVGVVNAVTSPTSSWIANGVVYGNWDYPTDSIMSSALAGASRANTISPPQLAAATLTNGATGFRETLLGSHPAAVDLGVPTTVQPAPAMPAHPDATQADLPDATQTAAAAPATVEAQTPSSVAASVAPSMVATPITAALTPDYAPDPTVAPSAPDPTALLEASRDSALESSRSAAYPDGTVPPAFIDSAGAALLLSDGSAAGAPAMLNANGPASSVTTSPAIDRHSTQSPSASSAVGSATALTSPRTTESGAQAAPSPVAQTTASAPVAASPTPHKVDVADAAPPGVATPRSPVGALVGSTPSGRTDARPEQDYVTAPSSPAGPETPQRPSGSGSEPSQSSHVLQRSNGTTASGTISYRLENRQADPSSDPWPQAAAAARELADRVDRTSESRKLTRRQWIRQTPLTAGALIARDGVIRAHTSMRHGKANVHPLVDAALSRIKPDLGPKARASHGRCAEVALISDFLHDFDATYSGPENLRADAALAALAGAQTTSVRIEAGTRHGEHKDPCKSCTELLRELRVIPFHAGATPYGGIPPSVRAPAPRDENLPTIPNDPAGGRPIGEPGGLDDPDPADQRALEDSVPRQVDGRPVRFPNPLGRWLGLVNDGGPAATPFRANNCLDTALSLLGTWQGNPQVSAPRTAEYTDDHTPSTAGETDGRQRAEETLGATFEYQGATAEAAFSALAAQLRSAGRGASAVLITSVAPSHGGGSHAWNAVNHNGTIHWIDAQIGAVSTRPLFEYAVDGVWSIVLDPNGQPLRTSQPPTVARGKASIEVVQEEKPYEGSPAAQSVPVSTFVPDGRASHLPDLVPGELLAAAARIQPEDFKNDQVMAIDGGDDAVTVRLTDGRSVRFEAAVGTGMQELATTSVGRHRNLVTVNARVAPEQLARVWVHEIAAALQEKPARGFFRRAIERAAAVAAAPLSRRAGVDALLEARLSERRYLIRSLASADSIASYQVLTDELGDLDRYLSDIGVAVRRLPSRPLQPVGLPLTSETDLSWSEPWTDGLAADPTPPWVLEGRSPLLDDLVPRTESEASRLHDAIATAVEARLVGPSYAGSGVRIRQVDVGKGYVVARVDVVDSTGRTAGIVQFSVNRDVSGTLYARLEQIRMNESVRGARFATTFNAHLERWYVESGVSRIELRAVDAGAYAWAQDGFYWASPSAADRVFERLRVSRDQAASQASLVRRWFAGQSVPPVELETVAAAYPGIAPEVVLADLDQQREAADGILRRARSLEFRGPGYPSPNEVGSAGRSGVGRDWVGRRALNGAEWVGARWLDPSAGPRSPAGAEPSGVAPMPPRQMMKPATPAPVGVRAATLSDLGFSAIDGIPEDARATIQQALPRTQMVNPTGIAFTQRSIGKRTRDGLEIDDLARRIAEHWRGGPLHGVQWGDGSLASLDNRRLTAARRAGVGLVPFVAHAPNELLSDWPEDWSAERRRFAAATVEIRQLADGRWAVGGDQGEVVYAVGAVPETFGEVALFRAAMGRDLLPGHLFGSSKLPVTVGYPRRSGKPTDLVSDELTTSDRAIATDLAEVTSQLLLVPARLSSQPLLPDRNIEQDYFKSEGVAAPPALVYAIELPDGDLYGPALRNLVELLHRKGYEPLRATNSWSRGNARRGLQTLWRSPHAGRSFGLLLPTRWSARFADESSDWLQVLVDFRESAVRKIHVILRLLAATRTADPDALPRSLGSPPDQLAHVWDDRDDSFAAWIAQFPGVFADYRQWLVAEGWQLGDVIAEFGLEDSDLPIRPETRDKLERQHPDVLDLLLALYTQHRGPRASERRSPRADDVGRVAVESPREGLGLRPAIGTADSVRSGQLGPLSGSGSGGGGGGDSGDHGRGAVAGRGDDSVALPVEGGTSGPGSDVAPPASPAGASPQRGPAGPFAREDPAPPLSATRQYGEENLRHLEDESYRDDVKEALTTPGGYAVGADPRSSRYGVLINDGGTGQPERDNNCLDCSLAALSSFYGRPEVSVPRWADGSPDGELNGIDRAMRWLGADMWRHRDDLPTTMGQFQALHDVIASLGPGSAALVVNVWQAEDEHGPLYDEEGYPSYGESHATVVVYPLGADGPVWWDPQEGLTADEPPEWLVSGTVGLSYITVEMDGRVNGDGLIGHPGSSTELPGSRRQAGYAVEHAPVPARMGAAVDSGNAGGDRARAATGQVDLGSRGDNGTHHGARALSATGDHPAVPGSDRGGTGSRGSADLPETAATGSDIERGATRADVVGRIGEALLLRESPVGDDRTGDRDGTAQWGGRSSVDPMGSRHQGLEVPRRPVLGAGAVRSAVPADRSAGGGSTAPDAERYGPAIGGRTASALSGQLKPDAAGIPSVATAAEREDAVLGSAAAHGLVEPADVAAVASAYDVATRWTAPYLVAAVDRLLQQLNPQATGDVRFLFITADDTVPWIVGRLAPDFARHHALWVQGPPTPTGWRHLRAQHPATLVTDDPATVPVARPLLLPTAPGSRLVGRLHGPVPDSAAITAAQRMAARAAVAAVVRAAMRAGPEAGRATVYAAATQLDRQASDGHADPLLAHWLQRA